MQIATLNYQYDPKDNASGDSRAKLRQRQILTTITNPQKKHKHRKSLKSSDHSVPSNIPLPPIKKSGKRPSSIRIQGSGLTSSKLGDMSAYSFPHQLRTQSRQSNKSDRTGARSRSVSPAGTLRPTSKLIRLKFGYPIKLRSADFYTSNKSKEELRLLEESFVNDSIRSANQSRRSSVIPNYESLDDPHLRNFFQSPVVLDVLRKTLHINSNSSFQQNDRSSKLSKHRRSKMINPDDNLPNDYQRIVTKGSSGYAKLNGYDCIPKYAPARQSRQRSRTTDPVSLSSQRRSTFDSRLQRSTTTHDKSQTLANSSFNSMSVDSEIKRKPRQYEKSKQSKSSILSPLKHPVRQLVESTISNKPDETRNEQNSEIVVHSNESQD